MAENRLVIVVDGTNKMAYYWQSIYKNFLQRIVRNFCQNESTSQDPSSGGNYALGLIVYLADDNLNACPVQPSAWTKDMDIFLQWLSGLSFNGSGQNEAPIAEGLSNALMMFPSKLGGTVAQQLGKQHCILVGAHNPSSVPRALLLPKIKVLDNGEIVEVKIECQNADAKRVASSFPQSFVSLSVICPRQFPKLREIYKAGNISQQAEGSSIEYKHPQLLVLISNSFVEAHAALKQLEEENRSRFISEPDLICPFSDNFSEDDIRRLSRIFSTSSNQQATPVENDNGDDLMNTQIKPCDSLQLTPNVFANNIPTNAEQLGSNVSRSTDRKTTEARCSCSQGTSYSESDTLSSSSSDSCVPEKRRLSQLSEDLQQSQRACCICEDRMAENENCVKRKRFNGVDSLNVLARQRLESVGQDENNQASVLHSQAISDGYIKAWEGGITSEENGQIVLINRLVVYRKESQSEKIFSQWPRMLHLDHLIFWDNFNNIPYDATIEHLTIDEVAPCSLLDQMEERRLSAYIKLPQHTLILSNSNKKMRFIGQLYDQFYPLLENQIYRPE